MSTNLRHATLVAPRGHGDEEQDAEDHERDADPAEHDARGREPAARQVPVRRVDLALGPVAVDDRQRPADQRADDERANAEDEPRGGRAGRRGPRLPLLLLLPPLRLAAPLLLLLRLLPG